MVLHSLVGEDLSKEGDAYVADETAGRGVVVNDFRERFSENNTVITFLKTGNNNKTIRKLN